MGIFPEDDREQCGYGWLNFDWALRPWKAICRWHDRATAKGSMAERIGIPNWRIVKAWKDQANTLKNDPKVKANWFERRALKIASSVVKRVNHHFYEPEKRDGD